MKVLTKLEKNKTFWFLLGISLLFFIFRLPSLIEPNWYGDEGIYQAIGQSLSSGRMLYAETWDNKPPLLYIVYALFNGEQFYVRLFSVMSGILATGAFFYLTTLLFKKVNARIIATVAFTLLFATPILEGNIANAENFMLPLNIIAGVLIYIISIKNPLRTRYKILNSKYSLPFLSGLILGFSFLFKIVAVFDIAGFCVFLLLATLPKRFSFSLNHLKKQWKLSVTYVLPAVIGFVLPILLTGFYFLVQSTFPDFIRTTFASNVSYVGWKNKFILPQGLLILKLLLLAGSVLFMYKKRALITKSQLFIILWFIFSLFNTYFSGRPYMHYILVSLPALCLMLGLYFDLKKQKEKTLVLFILCLAFLFLNNTFKFSLKKSVSYYGNAISFLSGSKSVSDYQAFFDRKTPRDYELASFIRSHTDAKDHIFVWGDSAQIYALSKKLHPGRYTVSYHIRQYRGALEETQRALMETKPKYIITLKESPALPFTLPGYDSKFVLDEAVIYERSF